MIYTDGFYCESHQGIKLTQKEAYDGYYEK